MLELIKEFLTLQWMKKIVLSAVRTAARWVITRELWREWVHQETAVLHEVYTDPPAPWSVWRVRIYRDPAYGGTIWRTLWYASEKEAWDKGKEWDHCVVKNIDTGAIIVAQGSHPPQTRLPERAKKDRCLEEDIPF